MYSQELEQIINDDVMYTSNDVTHSIFQCGLPSQGHSSKVKKFNITIVIACTYTPLTITIRVT